MASEPANTAMLANATMPANAAMPEKTAMPENTAIPMFLTRQETEMHIWKYGRE